MPYKPLTLVYKAFTQAGMGNEAGTVKEAFLGQLQANGVDLEKVSIYRLACFLKGKVLLRDLPRKLGNGG